MNPVVFKKCNNCGRELVRADELSIGMCAVCANEEVLDNDRLTQEQKDWKVLEISLGELNKMDTCRHLLPEPGPEVVGQLISEIRRLRALPNYWLEQHGIENEKRGEIEAKLGQAEVLIQKLQSTQPMKGIPINFTFCPRCGEKMNPKHDTSL